MAATISGIKSTDAKFVPEARKGLHKPNAIEWMVMVTGVAICSVDNWGVFVGVPVAAAAFYSGFFMPPKVKRGLYFGACPHCGASMSATHYQTELGCPSCGQMVAVKDGRYVAA
jgi:predicted RNA-binding Zn-ribbon protein involved in translation (DUF1610 family)